jgi:hypothetical protein
MKAFEHHPAAQGPASGHRFPTRPLPGVAASKGIFPAAILVVLLCWKGDLAAYSGSGDGSPGNPHEIATAGDFQQLCQTPDDWYKSFVLTADIDLAGKTLTPVGNETTQFTGVFDGNGKVIGNAVINQPGSDYIGLFGHTGPYAQIRDLGAEGVEMTGNSRVGGLVGLNHYGTITACHATGRVSGAGRDIGGLAGWNYNGALISCRAAVTVEGTGATGYNIGGLAGLNDSGTLVSCHATGSVHGGRAVGGLVGSNQSDSLVFCYATGAVSGHGSMIGGLVGTNGSSGVITYCYAAGPVTGTDYNTGGLVGGNYNLIDTCYAAGAVSGYYNTGGLIGRMFGGMARACFWDTQTCLPATVGVGSGTSAGVSGRTTSQMKTPATFASAGWDISHTDGDISDWWMQGGGYPDLIWKISVVVPGVVGLAEADARTTLTERELLIGFAGEASETVPAGEVISQSLAGGLSVPGGTRIGIVVSLGVHYSGGSGTTADPYRIGSIRDWQVLMSDSTDWDKVYRLTADIDLSGVAVTPVGNQTVKFTGVLDGNGHSVMGVVIGSLPADNHVGLFGYAGYGCEIRNLGVEGVDITGGYNSTGGIVGTCDGGKLSACHASGTVRGTNDVGGLVGRAYESAIKSCHSTCSVNGTGNVAGGLAGANVYGTVTFCHATGPVSGTSWVGGLLGLNSSSSTITHCYAAGRILGATFPGGLIGYDDGGTPVACFWDAETSGMTDGVGNVDPDPGEVRGRPTAEMKTLSTFTAAGWDFSATDGNPAVWVMPADGYPRLVPQPGPEAPMRITEYGRDPVGGFTLRWTCKAGYSYQVRYSETLEAGDWRAVGPLHTVEGGVSSLSFTDTRVAGSVRRFYIVVENRQ